MEDCKSSINAFCSDLRRHCAHLESSCSSLRDTVNQKPSSLPSQDSPSLLTALVDRISLISREVETLHSMSIDTISFTELLGHCLEIYKQNNSNISALEDHLKEFGYTAEEPIDEDLEAARDALSELSEAEIAKPVKSLSKDISKIALSDRKAPFLYSHTENMEQLRRKLFSDLGNSTQYVSVNPEAVSLEDLGLSAAGLACLAQNEVASSSVLDYTCTSTANFSDKAAVQESFSDTASSGSERDGSNLSSQDVVLIKPVEEDEYLSSPMWLKMQVSFEELNGFVDDICQTLAKKMNDTHKQLGVSGTYILDQEDLSALTARLHLGSKMKPCLLFLVRLGRLRTGHANGAIIYHVVE